MADKVSFQTFFGDIRFQKNLSEFFDWTFQKFFWKVSKNDYRNKAIVDGKGRQSTANIYSQITVGNVTLPNVVLSTAIGCTHDSYWL